MKVHMITYTHMMDYNSSVLCGAFYDYPSRCIKGINNIDMHHDDIYLFDLVMYKPKVHTL